MIVIAAVITSLFAVFFHKRLLFTMFDKETAKAYGVKTHHVETIFSLVLATVIIASMSAIGVTMLAAAIVAPAVSARMLTNKFQTMILLSTVIGCITSFAGMYASYFLNSASGATIVLFGATAFGISALYAFVKRKYHAHSHAGMVHVHPHSHVAEHRHEH